MLSYYRGILTTYEQLISLNPKSTELISLLDHILRTDRQTWSSNWRDFRIDWESRIIQTTPKKKKDFMCDLLETTLIPHFTSAEKLLEEFRCYLDLNKLLHIPILFEPEWIANNLSGFDFTYGCLLLEPMIEVSCKLEEAKKKFHLEDCRIAHFVRMPKSM